MTLSPEVAYLCEDTELGAQPFTVRRRTGSYVGGRFVANSDVTLTAIGNIQPASPEQLEVLPEGERTNETKVIYTRTLLYMTEGEKISDEITWHGDKYKILRSNRWDDWGFCIAYAVKR